jgi:outer membrane protein assembly factor BamB
MPGGMLSLSVDPSIYGGGVIFASITESYTPFETGVLRAFDPTNLNEIWNNTRDPQYRFAKFCPPTIADGKVFVPTFSNKVLVYGPI